MTSVMDHIDLALISLYLFWLFFFGLVYWIRMADRREGYPLEREDTGWVGARSRILMGDDKVYVLPHGAGTYVVPNNKRDTREIKARKTANYQGAPLEPTGNPMVDGVGPAAFAERHDEPELSVKGEHLIVPMRVADGFKLSKDSGDPRNAPVECADGKVAGLVKEIWVDRADFDVRYLEVQLEADGSTRLLPMPMVTYNRFRNKINVASILSTQFTDVPQIKNPDQVTALEEDKICAYFGGGHLYATPDRLGPLL